MVTINVGHRKLTENNVFSARGNSLLTIFDLVLEVRTGNGIFWSYADNLDQRKA